MIWEAKFIWPITRSPFIIKRQCSYSLHRQKGTYFALALADRLSKPEAEVMAVNSPKQKALRVVAQYGCQDFVVCVGKWPWSKVWIHLSSIKVWKTTGFMHFTELLADWFNIHRASTVTDGGDNCKWERNIDRFLLFLTIWSHTVLGTLEWDCAATDNHMVFARPFPHVS